MTLPNFYVKDRGGKVVPAKYLEYNGTPILDPNADTAKNTEIYDQHGIKLPSQNTNGYFIVPGNYSIDDAIKFAKTVGALMQPYLTQAAGVSTGGIATALTIMTVAFVSGGSQDLQLTYNGSGHGSTINDPTNPALVKAFTDAASFHLGLVSRVAGIPLSWTEYGGGRYNHLANMIRASKLDENGPYGLRATNGKSIQAGYDFGSKLPGAPAQPLPSNDNFVQNLFSLGQYLLKNNTGWDQFFQANPTLQGQFQNALLTGALSPLAFVNMKLPDTRPSASPGAVKATMTFNSNQTAQFSNSPAIAGGMSGISVALSAKLFNAAQGNSGRGATNTPTDATPDKSGAITIDTIDVPSGMDNPPPSNRQEAQLVDFCRFKSGKRIKDISGEKYNFTKSLRNRAIQASSAML